MEVDNTGSIVSQSEQCQKRTAQKRRLRALVKELKESSSRIRTSPDVSRSERVDDSSPDLNTLSGVNVVKRRQVQTDKMPHSTSIPIELATWTTTGSERYVIQSRVMARGDLFT